MVRLLFWMSLNQEYNELIEPELESLAELHGITPEQFKLSHYRDENGDSEPVVEDNEYNLKFNDYYTALVRGEEIDDKRIRKSQQNVFYYATVPSEEHAIAMFDRSIQLKAIIDVWTEGQSYSNILQDIKTQHQHNVEQTLVGKSWCVKYNCFNAKNDTDKLVAILEEMTEVFERAGKVDIKNPETKIAIIENYFDDKSRNLRTIYFGRYLRDRSDIGYWWDHYALSKRPILAPTTLENMLAFIMANLALVKKGSVVLDPFAGSAGSLITASHFGAVCFGSDIDMRILKGWGVAHHNRNLPQSDLPTHIYTNFKFYGLTTAEMLRFDNRYTVWRSMGALQNCRKEWVDAIITDPPYGIRASAKHRRLLHDGTGNEAVHCLIGTLLDLAESMLVPGGRLVFLLPTKNDRLTDALHVIKRDKLLVKHLGLQSLTGGASRFIVVLEKAPTPISSTEVEFKN